uniref:Uncharacterized protein n=1 Tax=Aquila chrysaetos chrysaetos TaxID=223781 RepID=A0A663EPE2_AQUCH
MQPVALLLLCPLAAALSGRFWHVTDLHWDPDYEAAAGAGQVCPSAGSRAVPAAGPWGSYLCDAPWRLLASAVRAMRNRLQRPDFVLWTGGGLGESITGTRLLDASKRLPTSPSSEKQ